MLPEKVPQYFETSCPFAKAVNLRGHGRIHDTKWTDATGTDRSRPNSAETENADLVDRDDEIPI